MDSNLREVIKFRANASMEPLDPFKLISRSNQDVPAKNQSEILTRPKANRLVLIEDEDGNQSKYKLLYLLDKGTSSYIFKAKNVKTYQIVAIKIKKPPTTLTKSEGLILSQLNHPNIVQLISYSSHKDVDYVVMGYANSGDLLSYLSSGIKLDEKSSKPIFRQLVAGLSHAHGESICHRDVKPENIIIFDHKRFVLADWGFATFYSADKPLTKTCGSFPYNPPEIIQEMPYIGPETDVWSLGVVLYYMVAGRHPFECNDVEEMTWKIINGSYFIPIGWTKDLNDLISGMLEVDPTKRLTIQEIEEHPWVKYDRNSLTIIRLRPSKKQSPRKRAATEKTRRVPLLDISNDSNHSSEEGRAISRTRSNYRSRRKSILLKLSPRSIWRNFSGRK